MFVVKFGRSIKNNPKKSIAGAVVLSWVAKWLEKRYQADLFRKAECQNAALLGRQTLHQLATPKRITVLLNPAACNGKASQMYEKYAAPILHLAGCDVQMVKLSYEGEAKKLMSVVHDTDMIVCAGGDGTLSEIVTGLLRRPDDEWRKIAIGVIPLGKKNTMCRRLVSDADYDKQPHFICKAASVITKSASTPVDVMKIEGSSGNTVYALSSIRWGTYCDLQEKVKKYWFLGPLKTYMPFVVSQFSSDIAKAKSFDISYTDPEDVPLAKLEEEIVNKLNTISASTLLSKIFRRFWPWKSSSEPKTEKLDKEPILDQIKEINWHVVPQTSIEFTACANTHLSLKNDTREKAAIRIALESDTVSRSDFLSKGPLTNENGEHSLINSTASYEADMFKLSSEFTENSKEFISIDNDRYEAMDITVQLLPNSINMICS